MLTKGDIELLVREYIAQETLRELQNGGVMAVRVLGEVLANKPGMLELVVCAAMDVARELMKITIVPPRTS